MPGMKKEQFNRPCTYIPKEKSQQNIIKVKEIFRATASLGKSKWLWKVGVGFEQETGRM